YVPHAALDVMLEGTRLVGRRDDATGALSVTSRTTAQVRRAPLRSASTASGGANGTEASNSSNSSSSSDVIELSPFNVNSDRDSGFVAASALAGGRLSLDLKDTPVAYSVLTRDFIDA